MRLFGMRGLLLTLLLLGAAGPARGQGRPPSPPPSFVPPPIAWWKDPQFKKALALSADQSNRIEGIFQQTLPHLRHKRDELDAQETELSRLVETDADEGLIKKQADRVESTRAALNTARTLMLVHMRQALTHEQRIRMATLREQWDRDHRPPPQRN